MIHKLLRAAAVLGLPSQTPYPSEGITSSIDGWSPKPTQGPLGNGLVRRQSDDRTCGYINGISSRAWSCVNDNDICISNIVSHYIGCCDADATQCDMESGCINRSDSADCDDDCRANSRLKKCFGRKTPYCNTGYFGSASQYTGFFCGSRSRTYDVSLEYTEDESSTTSSRTTTRRSTKTSTTSLGDSDDGGTQGSTTTGAGDLSPAFDADEVGATTETETLWFSDSDDDVNIGAIVGGVLGGLSLLGGLAIGIVFLLLRHRRQKKRDADSAAASKTQETKAELPDESVAHSNTFTPGYGESMLLSPASNTAREIPSELPSGGETRVVSPSSCDRGVSKVMGPL